VGSVDISPDEHRLAWRTSMADGGLHAIHLALTNGPFLPAFGLLLGASPFELGILGAITPLAMVGGAFLDRLPVRRKPMAMWAAAASRYLWVVIAVLPFVPMAAPGKVPLFLGLYALSALLMQTAGLAWLDWIGDLIGAESRGRYFAWRNAMMTGLTMLCVLLSGPLLDVHKAAGQEAWGFAVMLLVACLAAVGCRWTIAHQPDPTEGSRPPHEAMSPATPAWRSFLWFLGLFLLVAGLAGPFYTAYALQTLGMDYRDVAQWSLLGNLTGMITQPLIGRFIDSGRRNGIMVTATLGTAGLPLLWLAAHPGMVWTIWLDGLCNGIVWTTFTLCQTYTALELSPVQGRRRHLGHYTAVTGMASGMSALLGGWLIERHWLLPLQGPKLLFALTAGGRALCAIGLLAVIRQWRLPATVREVTSPMAAGV
jgi:Na+/melibiose symporter-like transporter